MSARHLTLNPIITELISFAWSHISKKIFHVSLMTLNLHTLLSFTWPGNTGSFFTVSNKISFNWSMDAAQIFDILRIVYLNWFLTSDHKFSLIPQQAFNNADAFLVSIYWIAATLTYCCTRLKASHSAHIKLNTIMLAYKPRAGQSFLLFSYIKSSCYWCGLINLTVIWCL